MSADIIACSINYITDIIICRRHSFQLINLSKIREQLVVCLSKLFNFFKPELKLRRHTPKLYWSLIINFPIFKRIPLPAVKFWSTLRLFTQKSIIRLSNSLPNSKNKKIIFRILSLRVTRSYKNQQAKPEQMN